MEPIIDLTKFLAKPPCTRAMDLLSAVMDVPQAFQIGPDEFLYMEFDDRNLSAPWVLYATDDDGDRAFDWESYATADEARAAVEALRTILRDERGGEAA